MVIYIGKALNVMVGDTMKNFENILVEQSGKK